MNHFHLWVNDERVEVRDEPPTTTLLSFLREKLRLTGTKEGCAEGDCGACTVAVLDPEATGGPRYRAINACLVLLPMMRGRRVYTIEGIADRDRLHPAQQAVVDHRGSQCGFCTPGVVMSMFEATYRDDMGSGSSLDDQMCGNLCRCTGYRPIREAASEVAGSRPDDRFARALSRLAEDAGRKEAAAPGDEDPMGAYETGHGSFYAPRSFEALQRVFSEKPDARVVCGGTDIGLLVTKGHEELPVLVSLESVPGMRRVEETGESLVFGGALPLTDLEEVSREHLPPLARMLRYFAARQIRHRATIGGNVCNASPIGDLSPVLLALGSTCILRGAGGRREIPISEFFLGYRKTALAQGEVLEAIEIPKIPAGARASAYKVSKRRELDISSVSAGFFVRTSDGGEVTEARLAYGGMAAVPARARRAEGALLGRLWSEEAVEAAAKALEADFEPIDDLRATAWYRRTVAANLLRGFYLETKDERLPALSERPSGTVEPRAPGGVAAEERDASTGETALPAAAGRKGAGR